MYRTPTTHTPSFCFSPALSKRPHAPFDSAPDPTSILGYVRVQKGRGKTKEQGMWVGGIDQPPLCASRRALTLIRLHLSAAIFLADPLIATSSAVARL